MRSRLVSFALITACSSGARSPATPSPAVAADPAPRSGGPEAKLEWAPTTLTLAQTGIVPGWIDKAVDPCHDFFAYACGGFTKSAQIPADRARWGAIEMVSKDNEDFLHKVLEDAAAATSSSDPVTAKIGAFYAACMDEPAIEKAGAAPIQSLLDEIAKVTDVKSAARVLSVLHAEGIPAVFRIGPIPDGADATQVIAELDQSGLGLPDRKYFLENTGTMAKTRDVYHAHLGRLFQLLGKSTKDAKAAADNAYRIELALAKVQQDDITRRNPHALYHRVERVGLEKLAPAFPWGDYLAALGIPDVTAITVNEPKYYTEVVKLLQREPAAVLRDYLTSAVLRARGNLLGHAWVDENFTMETELQGVKQLPPRWRRCVERVDNDLGELLGQSYVKARFGGDARTRATELTRSVLDAMRTELDGLAWMDEPTRAAAMHKLDKMAYLVGYPDKWRTYDFEVKRTDYAVNVRAAIRWERKRRLAKIGKPVDRFDWEMTPPTVNAYYEPSLNELALPAGQLQPPFFGAAFHPAVNFGSTGGGTIGHEMTHGFDDEGSQFDADGNLRDWWTKATKDRFGTATQCVVDEYAQFEAVPGVKLDGKLTAGENIADNGGVKLGYEAYKTWRAKQKPAVQTTIDGFSDDQLYFLAYAQSWCESITPSLLETMAHSNPHSPPNWRVNGVIVNQPGFGPAFSCAAGTAMNPGKPCSVW